MKKIQSGLRNMEVSVEEGHCLDAKINGYMRVQMDK